MLSQSASAVFLLTGLVIIVAGLAAWSTTAAMVVGGLSLVFLAFLWNRGADE
jgi:hypothetical protein